QTQILMRRAGIKVTPTQVTAASAAVHALVGELAPYQAPATADVRSHSHQPRRSGTGNRQRRRSSSRSAMTDPARIESGASRHSPTTARQVGHRRRSGRPQGATG
ncbi:MAG: ATP-dependent helicase, partial [Mycobacterium sp.]